MLRCDEGTAARNRSHLLVGLGESVAADSRGPLGPGRRIRELGPIRDRRQDHLDGTPGISHSIERSLACGLRPLEVDSQEFLEGPQARGAAGHGGTSAYAGGFIPHSLQPSPFMNHLVHFTLGRARRQTTSLSLACLAAVSFIAITEASATPVFVPSVDWLVAAEGNREGGESEFKRNFAARRAALQKAALETEEALMKAREEGDKEKVADLERKMDRLRAGLKALAERFEKQMAELQEKRRAEVKKRYEADGDRRPERRDEHAVKERREAHQAEMKKMQEMVRKRQGEMKMAAKRLEAAMKEAMEKGDEKAMAGIKKKMMVLKEQWHKMERGVSERKKQFEERRRHIERDHAEKREREHKDREHAEKRDREHKEREHAEKRDREHKEREHAEKRDREHKEREHAEKREREHKEREHAEKRDREHKEREHAEKRDREHKEREHAEKRDREHKEREHAEKREREHREREHAEKREREHKEREHAEKREREHKEREHAEKRDREHKERERHEREKHEWDHEGEHHEKGVERILRGVEAQRVRQRVMHLRMAMHHLAAVDAGELVERLAHEIAELEGHLKHLAPEPHLSGKKPASPRTRGFSGFRRGPQMGRSFGRGDRSSFGRGGPGPRRPGWSSRGRSLPRSGR